MSSPPSVTSGSFNAGTMLLLTDGSVLVSNSGGSNSNNGGSEWLKFTPDPVNGYAGGTWGSESDMANTRLFCASGILRDGRLFVVGGEVSTAGPDTPLAEIYDPNSNSWSTLTKPAAFNFIQGDCSGCVLPDGRVIFGALNSTQTAIWDPVNGSWVQSGTAFGTIPDTKTGWCNEEGWTLLADGTVMTVNVKVPTTSGGSTLNNAPNTAERYFPAEDIWRATATLPNVNALTNVLDKGVSPAVNVGVFEIGPAMLLPDKRLISFGATGHTAVWTPDPSDPKQPGTWAAGKDFPADSVTTVYPAKILTLSDAPAVLQPNGRVLVLAGSLYRNAGPPVDFFSQKLQVFEYDPVANSLVSLGTQPPSGATSQDTWTGRFLLLPTGEILLSTEQSQVYIYTPDPNEGSFQAAWQPAISSFPTTLIIGHSYQLTGTGLNGVSQANNYGDDAQMATNYPIVQLKDTNNGKIFYLRTQDFSSMGVDTSGPQTASVTVVQGTPPGSYNLVAIANGIPSATHAVQVGTQSVDVVLQEDQLSGGQVQAQINLAGAPAVFQTALYVSVEGFKLSDLGISGPGSLTSPGNQPTVTTNLSHTITFAYNGSAEVEDIAYAGPQKVLFPFQVSFTDGSVFSDTTIFPGTNQKATLPVFATFNPPGGGQLTAVSAMVLEKTPNPFLLHNDPGSTDTTVQQAWYLSMDLRVFQMTAGGKRFGANVPKTGNAVNDATGFISQAITNLNGDRAVADGLFEAIPENEDAASLSLAPTDGTNPVYSFALARVRTQDVAPANDVRVFFRMWAAQQTNAVYDPNTTYAFRTNGKGEKIPVLGVQNDQIVTVPFFASPRINAGSASMATQTDDPNVQAVIGPDSLGAEVHTFYGCWLDINQPGSPQFPSIVTGDAAGPFTSSGPLLAVQSFAKSAHQCLIAEISYDPDPIANGADPSNTGKLAQRNLAFVNVPNPGLTLSRVVPQTFEIRPSPAVLLSDGKPDELMIQWVGVPHGSTASIYLPDVSSAQVLDWGSRLYLTHRLTATDAHTIQMPIAGVNWIPVPQGSTVNYAGLLSVELPMGIKKGQQFKAVVRQITSAGGFGERGNTNNNALKTAQARSVPPWRTVLGQFSLTIPVSTKAEILPAEEKLLSIMKWIGKDIHPNNRWYPVFKRYLEQLGGRVTFMGGDPVKVIPTGTGNWKNPTGGGKGHGGGDEGGHGEGHDHDHDHDHDHHDHHHEFTGKVNGLIYDHFGDFEGFVLQGYDGVKHRFFSREMRVEERVRIACDARAVTTVIAGHDRSVVAIVIGVYE
ncbi:MAG: kelch repeat-containing protein [Gemmatimonadaceae bacterium]